MELTRVEFDLLACLLSAPGRVFTRAQLIDRVWGDGFAITDRTIDSHVKSLRRKVTEAGGDAGLIETVRGVGYRVTDRPGVRSEGASVAKGIDAPLARLGIAGVDPVLFVAFVARAAAARAYGPG
jgi:DNA-binding winged helix-turn-helix (wHTH) protein